MSIKEDREMRENLRLYIKDVLEDFAKKEITAYAFTGYDKELEAATVEKLTKLVASFNPRMRR